MQIRRAKKEDSKKIFDVHMRSIKEVCGKDYTSQQINAWSGRDYNPDHWPKIIEQSYVWVIAENAKIHGLSSLLLPESDKDLAHIMALYIAPEALRKGFGREFIKLAVEVAKSSGYSKIFANSTKTAKIFYLSMGFKQTGPDNVTIINGQPIEGHLMELIL